MRKKNWVHLFIALVLYIPLFFLQNSIDYSKKVEDLESGLLLMPGQMAGSLVLSGFKGLAADLLWLNVEEYWHSGQHYKMLPILDAVAWLQPTYATVWAVGGWHMAYNIFAQIGTDESKMLEQFEKEKAKLKAGDLAKYQAAIDAAALSRQFSESGGLLWKDGMAEPRLPEYVKRIDRAEAALSQLASSEAKSPLVNLAGVLLSVPKGQLFWYQQGVRFLKRGVGYNPNKYDVYFELGWTFYHKGKDYPNAVRYLQKAAKHPHPDYVDDVLAHAYEKSGQIKEAITQWEYVKVHAPTFASIADRMIKDLKKKGSATP
jgi:tetratricopeptide (TPR) repeat protein